MDGILLVDKPEGVSSAAVVRDVKRLLRCKVGHLGTLDPFASGLLPLCLDEGTKIAQFLNTADKRYEGVIRLGQRTDTGDRTGTPVEEGPLPSLEPGRCAALAASFLGDRQQTPPMYSALKKDGVALYKLARQGVEIDRAPRAITIHAIGIEPVDAASLSVRVHCSKGTYIRVLAEEIGAALGTVAHLASLRRTSFGHFGIEAALAPPLTAESAAEALITPREALRGLEEMSVDGATAERMRLGQMSALAGLRRAGASGANAKVVGPDGALLAVITADSAGRWQFARVLTAAPSFT
jgi:tRNA pseudouridine55 synthase